MGDESVNPGPWRPWKLRQESWASSEADGESEKQREGQVRLICALQSSCYGEGEEQMNLRYEGGWWGPVRERQSGRG